MSWRLIGVPYCCGAELSIEGWQRDRLAESWDAIFHCSRCRRTEPRWKLDPAAAALDKRLHLPMDRAMWAA